MPFESSVTDRNPCVDQVLEPVSKGRIFPFSTWFRRSTKLPHTRAQFISRCFAPLRASTSGSPCPRAAVHRQAVVRRVDE